MKDPKLLFVTGICYCLAIPLWKNNTKKHMLVEKKCWKSWEATNQGRGCILSLNHNQKIPACHTKLEMKKERTQQPSADETYSI